jgi:hypothetical protein
MAALHYALLAVKVKVSETLGLQHAEFEKRRFSPGYLLSFPRLATYQDLGGREGVGEWEGGGRAPRKSQFRCVTVAGGRFMEPWTLNRERPRPRPGLGGVDGEVCGTFGGDEDCGRVSVDGVFFF